MEGPDVHVCTAGGPCNLTCFAEGVPSPNMTWFHNELLVSDAGSVEIITPPGSYSTRDSTLRFGNTSLTDAGNYVCRASNFLVHHENDSSLPALLTIHCEYLVLFPNCAKILEVRAFISLETIITMSQDYRGVVLSEFILTGCF